MTTRPSRYLPVSSSCSTRPRFWSVASSRDAVDLCRPSRRASSVTPASPWLSPRARSRAAARSTERTALPSRTIASPAQPAPGDAMPPCGVGAVAAVGAGLERRVERVREDRDDPVDDVAARRAPRRRTTARASRARASRRGRACRSRSRRTARGRWWPSRGTRSASSSRNMIPNIDGWPGEVVRQPGRVEDLARGRPGCAARWRGSSRARPCRG